MSSIKKVLCVESKRTDLATKGFIYDVVDCLGGDYLQINSDKGTPLVIGTGDFCLIGKWQPLEEYICMAGIYPDLKIGDTFFGYKVDGAIICPQFDGWNRKFRNLSNFKKVSEMTAGGDPKKRFEVRHVVYDTAHNEIIDDAMGECYITLAEAQELCDEMNAPKVMKPVFTKEVEYFGVKIMVPEDAKWIATYKTGLIMSTSGGFELSSLTSLGWINTHGMLNAILMVDLNGIDWKETLVEIK